MSVSSFRSVLEAFTNSVSVNVARYAMHTIQLSLPHVPLETAISICQTAKQMFQDEQPMLEVHSPCTVVGDIHGHILDLFRILNTMGYPPRRKYVFLGDIVDRGEFSVETVIVVFLLKILYPSSVYVIRGNHEFGLLSEQCGFFAQVVEVYGNPQFYEACMDAFSFLPMSARIDNQILCVHGGIGPEAVSLSQFRAIRRPVTEFGIDFLDSVLWSDPSTDCDMFAPSSRGSGYFFGAKALGKFMESCDLQLIVRGHECVVQGIEWFFEKKLVTVFSASNYCGIAGNEAGVLEIEPGLKYVERRFPPLEYLGRNYVIFKKKDFATDPVESRKFTRENGKAMSTKDVPAPRKKILSVDKETASYRELPRLALETRAVAPKENSTALPSLTPRYAIEPVIRPPTGVPSHRRRRSLY